MFEVKNASEASAELIGPTRRIDNVNVNMIIIRRGFGGLLVSLETLQLCKSFLVFRGQIALFQLDLLQASRTNLGLRRSRPLASHDLYFACQKQDLG